MNERERRHDILCGLSDAEDQFLGDPDTTTAEAEIFRAAIRDAKALLDGHPRGIEDFHAAIRRAKNVILARHGLRDVTGLQ